MMNVDCRHSLQKNFDSMLGLQRNLRMRLFLLLFKTSTTSRISYSLKIPLKTWHQEDLRGPQQVDLVIQKRLSSGGFLLIGTMIFISHVFSHDKLDDLIRENEKTSIDCPKKKTSKISVTNSNSKGP
jgi:hypothetical protein